VAIRAYGQTHVFCVVGKRMLNARSIHWSDGAQRSRPANVTQQRWFRAAQAAAANLELCANLPFFAGPFKAGPIIGYGCFAVYVLTAGQDC